LLAAKTEADQTIVQKSMTYLSCQQCRRADQIAIEEMGIPSLTLMENAGLASANAIMDLNLDGGTVVLCGTGNNGGDGFVIARHLHTYGKRVRVILVAESSKASGDALANLQRLSRIGISPIELKAQKDIEEIRELLATIDGSKVSIIVDAMLGTGASGPLRAPFDRVVGAANTVDATRVAIDLPSGLNGDNGQVDNNAFRADLTCTFIALKHGMNTACGREYCGEVKLLNIGLPDEAIMRASLETD
jgi:NAD(P)H-hydrate epimerase